MSTSRFPTLQRTRSARRGIVLASLSLLTGVLLHATVLDRSSSSPEGVRQKRAELANDKSLPGAKLVGPAGCGPTSLAPGKRIVVMTADGSYVERAKG